MDGIIKGPKSAANEIDKKAGLSGDSSLGAFASIAGKVYHEAVESGTTGTGAAEKSAVDTFEIK